MPELRSAPVRAFVGLGSNLDDPRRQIALALAALENLPASRVVQYSSLYRSRPMGPQDQPDFINAVAELETRLMPEALLGEMQAIEAAQGRVRGRKWGPRTLDLDLLLYASERISTPGLVVPHPGLPERAFVLYPLAELAPDMDVPGIGRLAERIAGLGGEGIERLPAPAARPHLPGRNPDKLMSNEKRPRYLVVEGPIGAGKTSLARRLAAHFGSDLVLEQAEENPFLERFYRDPKRFALPAQLFFLFQRARQIQDMRQDDLFSPVRVADFLLEKDALFAELTLAPDELALYRQTYEHLAIDAPRPDLVVYLQAPADVLLHRVRKRGIAYEQDIEPEYLEKLADAYTRFFHNYNASPLLIVNAREINPVERDADFQQLLRAVEAVKSGRHYFNPVPDFA